MNEHVWRTVYDWGLSAGAVFMAIDPAGLFELSGRVGTVIEYGLKLAVLVTAILLNVERRKAHKRKGDDPD